MYHNTWAIREVGKSSHMARERDENASFAAQPRAGPSGTRPPAKSCIC